MKNRRILSFWFLAGILTTLILFCSTRTANAQDTGSISGIVTDGGGVQSLNGIMVIAFSGACNGDWLGSSWTDVSGNYTITELPAGQVWVQTASNGYYINEWWNGVTECNDAAPVPVTVGQVTQNINFSLALGGKISGHVADAFGQDLEGVLVVAHPAACQGHRLQAARTDDAGNYTLMGVTAGNIYVSTSAGGYYVDEWWEDVIDCYDARPVPVTMGQVTPNINFSLTLGGDISGIVTDGEGNPIPGIWVEASSGACSGDRLQWIRADESGMYTFTGLPVGQAYIRTSSDGQNYINEWWPGVTDCSAAQPVPVTAGQVTPNINFTLAPGGSISGRVVDDLGQPIPGIYVRANSGACGGQLQDSQTDDSGYYITTGLPAGNVYVETRTYMTSLNYINEWWNGVTDCSTAEPVQVTVGQVMPNINFSLTRGGGISGQVTDGDGHPLAGTAVKAYAVACGASYLNWTNSDASGNYTIGPLPPGQVYVEVSQGPDYTNRWYNNAVDCEDASPVLVAAGQLTQNINFSIALTGRISGQVTTEGGVPLAGIRVYAYAGPCDMDEIDQGGSQTDASGNYTITHLPVGQVYVQADDTGQNYINQYWEGTLDCSTAEPVTVTGGQVTQNINFSLLPGQKISGRVTDGNGDPLEGIYVLAYFGSCNYIFNNLDYGQTNAAGEYTIPGLPAGERYVRTYSNGNFLDEWYNGVTDCSAALPVTVVTGQETTGIDFILGAGGNITGHIADLDGNPLGGIYVLAYDGCGSFDSWLNYGQTDAAGDYTITALPAGQLLVRTYTGDDTYVDQWWDGVTDCSAAKPVPVIVGQEKPGINFSLGFGGGPNATPTTANNTVVTLENTDLVFALADFPFIDADAGDNLQKVQVVTRPSAGTCYRDANGNGVVDFGETAYPGLEFQAAGITAGLIKFKPAANTNGSPYASFTFKVSDGLAYSAAAATMTINVTAATNVNETPTDIALSAASVPENQPAGTTVGTLSTADPDAGNTFTYTLVSGTGSADNTSFTIAGNALRTAAMFNFESKSSYSIRVRTTDQGALWFEKAFTITVTHVNETPTDIALSAASVPENQPAGTTVGTLSTTDPDAGNTFTYTLVSGTGSADNTSFTIEAGGSTLATAVIFDFETKSTYSIRVRATDQGVLWFEKTFIVTVTDVYEPPPDIAVQFSLVASAGPEATTPAVLDVSLSAPSLQTVTVLYATANGTAVAGSDYTASSGKLSFAPGVTSQSIKVAISSDTAVEEDETFTVRLTAPTNAILGAIPRHTRTIANDDFFGSIQLFSATYSVDEGAGTVTIKATRSGGRSGGVSVQYSTTNKKMTAKAGKDYTSASGTLTWDNGDRAYKIFTVPIADDTLDEAEETFKVVLKAPTGGATLGSPSTGTVTIIDNDPTPKVRFRLAKSSGAESKNRAGIEVTLLAESGRTVTVDYATANGSALAGSDYLATSGTLNFSPGVTIQTVTVPIINDTAVEPNETLTVTLNTPVNASLGKPSRHVYTITNDDANAPDEPGSDTQPADTSRADGGGYGE